jgi:hypothetical protein
LRWRLRKLPGRGRYRLLTAFCPKVSVNRKSRTFDVHQLMRRLDRAGVPPAYTDWLNNIRFTNLLGDAKGLHWTGEMSVELGRHETMSTFIHELGHNVDELLDISSDGSVVREHERRRGLCDDKYARGSVQEHVAVGFQLFYESPEMRAELRRMHPCLYRKILQAHRLFSKP